MQQLEDQHPERPNIRLRTIDVLDEALGRHVDRRADVNVLELTLRQLGKTKIGQLRLPVVDEYVGDLEVAMNYVVFCQV